MAIHKIKFFAGRGSRYLAEKIVASYGTKLGESEVLNFSDGEFQPCFLESIRGCTVFVIQSTFPPTDNLMELLMMIDAAKRASAHQVIAVMPYFGWARQDRKDRPRVPIGAKLVANLLVAAGVDRIMTMDLHADQIQGFFDVPVDALYASGIFVPSSRASISKTCRSLRPTWAEPSAPTPMPNTFIRRSSFRTRSVRRPTS